MSFSFGAAAVEEVRRTPPQPLTAAEGNKVNQMLAGEWKLCMDGAPVEQHHPLTSQAEQASLSPRAFEKYNTIDVNGTSLRGTMFGVSPVDLVHALGPGDDHDLDGSCLEWHFKVRSVCVYVCVCVSLPPPPVTIDWAPDLT
jgi:hypothetical protein